MIGLPSRTRVRKLELVREGAIFRGAVSVSACGEAELMSVCEEFLHQREAEFLETDGLGRWGAGFVRGRCCAKAALAALHDGIDVHRISIEKGVFSQPVVRGEGVCNAQVSISHSGGWAAAVAFDEAHPMAIDIELFSANKQDTIQRETTVAELDAIARTMVPSPMRLTMLWTIKEALSKVLLSGLMSPIGVYEISDITQTDGIIVSTFKNFAQYKCLSFQLEELGLSIALPGRTEVDLDLEAWRSISR